MTTVETRTAPTFAEEVSSNPHHERRWLILVFIALAQLVVVLDATIVNIALPSAQQSLGFSNDNRQWIITAYALAFGSLLLVGGRLGDLFGRRPMFITGLLGFAAASAVGGAAESFGVLVAARGAQGVFGALLAPAALSLLSVSFSDLKERARAFAIFGAVAGGGGAVGLILGGVLTEYLSWRWCLYVNVPVAIIAAIGGAVLLKKQPRAAGAPTLDVLGSIVVVAGLVSLVYGLATAESRGWTSTITLGFIAVGLVLLVVFVWLETRVKHPLLPLRVVLDRNRGGSFIAVGIIGAGMFGVFLFLTYYMATTLGYSPVMTGVAFMPMILGLMVTAQFAVVIATKIGVKVPVTAGMVTAAVGMVLLTQLRLDSSYWTEIFPGLLVLGVGIGLAISPAFSAATQGVANDDAGVASAMVNTLQQIGGSIATAVLSAVAATAASNYLVGKTADPAHVAQAAMESYTTAFWFAAAIFATGAVVCGALLRHGAVVVDPDAAPVMMH